MSLRYTVFTIWYKRKIKGNGGFGFLVFYYCIGIPLYFIFIKLQIEQH